MHLSQQKCMIRLTYLFIPLYRNLPILHIPSYILHIPLWHCKFCLYQLLLLCTPYFLIDWKSPLWGWNISDFMWIVFFSTWHVLSEVTVCLKVRVFLFLISLFVNRIYEVNIWFYFKNYLIFVTDVFCPWPLPITSWPSSGENHGAILAESLKITKVNAQDMWIT